MLKIQYRDAKDGGIEVLRCFSKEDQVEIPSEIEGISHFAIYSTECIDLT